MRKKLNWNRKVNDKMDLLDAKELYEIAIKERDNKVKKLFSDVYESIAHKILEKATIGCTEYTYKFERVELFCLEQVTEKLIPVCEWLESKHLTVKAVCYDNSYWANVYLYIRWDGKEPVQYKGLGFQDGKVVYESRAENEYL